MSKNCPHCNYELSKADYKQFLDDQYGDWMICPECQGKLYIVLPAGKGFLKVLVTLLAVLPLILLGAFAGFAAIGNGMQYFPEIVGEIDIRIMALAFFFLMGGVYVVATRVARAIHWKMSVAQKSPFI